MYNNLQILNSTSFSPAIYWQGIIAHQLSNSLMNKLTNLIKPLHLSRDLYKSNLFMQNEPNLYHLWRTRSQVIKFLLPHFFCFEGILIYTCQNQPWQKLLYIEPNLITSAYQSDIISLLRIPGKHINVANHLSGTSRHIGSPCRWLRHNKNGGGSFTDRGHTIRQSSG